MLSRGVGLRGFESHPAHHFTGTSRPLTSSLLSERFATGIQQFVHPHAYFRKILDRAFFLKKEDSRPRTILPDTANKKLDVVSKSQAKITLIRDILGSLWLAS